MLKLKITILFLFSILFSFGQSFVLTGDIQEDLSKTPISNVNVFLLKSGVGTTSMEDGFYELNVADSSLNDTLVISYMGYKEQKVCINSIYPDTNFSVFLQDSMFLLDEVVAFCYDYIEALYWTSKKNDKKDYLLTFVSKDITNVSNFILLLNERLGKGKKKRNTYVWKKLEIPGIAGKTKVSMKFFRCGYCPDNNNITVTFALENSEITDILHDDEYKLIFARYFQEILDKTFENGINIVQLEKRKRIYYLPNAEDPYTGKTYGYFESGQKGLRGEIFEGKKDKKWEYWYKNNNKRMVVFFDKGKKTSLWVSWFKNGSIRIKNNYVKGRLEGNNFWWYENGTLKKVAFYKNGIIQGKLEWEENGDLKEMRGMFENATDEEVANIKGFKFQDKKIAKYIQKFM